MSGEGGGDLHFRVPCIQKDRCHIIGIISDEVNHAYKRL